VKHEIIWKKPYCAPCYTSKTAFDRKNPKYWNDNHFICYVGTHECIKSISVDEIKNKLDKMIAELKALKKEN